MIYICKNGKVLLNIPLEIGESASERKLYDLFDTDIDFNITIPFEYGDDGEFVEYKTTKQYDKNNKIKSAKIDVLLPMVETVVKNKRNNKAQYEILLKTLNIFKEDEDVIVVFIDYYRCYAEDKQKELKNKRIKKDEIISIMEKAKGNIFSVTPQDGFIKVMAYNGGGHKFDLKEDKGMSKETIVSLHKAEDRIDEAIEQLYDLYI